MLRFLRKKRINSIKKDNKRKKKFLIYNNIQKVLIFFDIKHYAQVVEVIEALKADGKSVTAWTVRHRNQVHMLPVNIKVVDERKDLSITQAISPQILNEFESLKYDTLIDFSLPDDYIFEYLLASNKSRFCIGVRETPNIKLYDFIMRKPVNDSLLDIFEEMKYYLESIK